MESIRRDAPARKPRGQNGLRAAVVGLLALAAGGCADLGGGGGAASGTPVPVAPPAIATVSPDRGAPGTVVAIAGDHFEAEPALNAVFFGRARAEVLSATPTRVFCAVPAGAPAGTVVPSVSTRRGTARAASGFDVVAVGGAPVVREVRDDAGDPIEVAFEGQTVRVVGSGFGAGELRVLVGGVAVDVVALISDEEVQVSLGAEARSGVVAAERGSARSTGGPTLFVCAASPVDGVESGGVGAASGAALLGVPFTHIVVELDVQDRGGETFDPEGAALDILAQRLSERLHKPGGALVVRAADTFASSERVFTVGEVRRTAGRVRDRFSRANTLVLHYLFLGGEHSPNDQVVGLAYEPTQAAIFEERIRSGLGLLGSEPNAEAAVMVHELGHLLGLVDISRPMVRDHEDRSAPGHCENDPDCVMKASVNTASVGGLTQPTDFFTDCLDDLREAGAP